MRTRAILVGILILLVLLLFGVGWAFFSLVQPAGKPQNLETVNGFRWVRSLYGYGDTLDTQLQQPADAEFDSSGRMYVTDQANGRIFVFNADGTFRDLIAKAEGDGAIDHPVAIAFGDDGDMYIADSHRNKIIRLTRDGTFVTEWDDELPLALTVKGERVYVAAGAHISVFSTDGEVLSRFGERGREEGQFDFPHGIACADDGTIWIADGNNTRLQHVKEDGTVLRVIGEPPAGAMQGGRKFGLPVGLSLIDDKYLLLSDALNFSLVVLDLEGNEVAALSAPGGADGELWYPSGISYDARRGLVVVADTGNDRAEVFSLVLPGETGLAQRGRRLVESPFCYGPLLLLLILVALWIVNLFTRRRRDSKEVATDADNVSEAAGSIDSGHQ